MKRNGQRCAATALVVMSVLLTACAVWAQEEVTVTGRVVGPHGEAIAGVEVWWHDSGTDGTEWRSVKTDADGGFELIYTSALLRYLGGFLVAVEGYALAVARPGDGPLEIRLSREMGSISGTIVGPEGEPLAGVDVRVRSLKEPGSDSFLGGFDMSGWLAAPAATTDEQGHFRIGALPPGYQIALLAEREGMDRYSTPHRGDWPTAGDEVQITMSPPPIIAGRVTRDGEPVANVRVAAWPGQQYYYDLGTRGEATTGDDGRYEIHGLYPSSYKVALTPPDGFVAPAHEAVPLARGVNAEGIDFELTEGATLRGLVTWADTDEPVGEAVVAVYGPAYPESSSRLQTTKTGTDGRYELRLLPGRRCICWKGSPPGAWDAEQKEVWVELEEGVDQIVDFRLLRSPIITITVLNPDGTPAAGVEVDWDSTAPKRSPFPETGHLTDADGRVEVTFGRNVWEGKKHMAVALVQDTARDLAGFAIVNVATYREATITLQQAAWVVTSVTDRDGDPLADIPVHARARDLGWNVDLPDSPKTGADGQARLGPLPAGVRLEFKLDDKLASDVLLAGPDRLRPIELAAGETRELSPFVIMPEGYLLRGTVVDADGDPVEGALVIAGKAPELQTTTDAEGRFEIKGLTVLHGTMVIAAHPDGSAAYIETVDPRVPLDLTIELAEPITIVATVLDDDGQPVVGASAGLARGNYSAIPPQVDLPEPLLLHASYLQTDENGQFRLENLVVGQEYFVYAHTGKARTPGWVRWVGHVTPIGGEGVIEMTLTRERRR